MKFPVHWDSSSLEAFVPGLTDLVGYDVPLSARFKNIGAPRFVFNKQETNVLFSMAVEVWSEHYVDYYFTINFYDIFVDFEMWLEQVHHTTHYMLNTEWYTLEYARVEIESDVLHFRDQERVNKVTNDYFNFILQQIIPWVNDVRPINVARIPLPNYLNNEVRIKGLKMSVRENYFSFTCYP